MEGDSGMVFEMEIESGSNKLSNLKSSEPTPELLDLRGQHRALMDVLKDVHGDSGEFKSFVAKLESNNLIVGLHLKENKGSAELYEFLRPCAESVVEGGISHDCLKSAYFVLALYLDSGVSVASLAASFLPYPANTVETRFESVHKDFHGRGYGGLLFDALSLVVPYMAVRDPFICLNLMGQKSVSAHVYVDEEDPTWHLEMLERRGFKQIDLTEEDECLLERVFFI